jgi:hypothetical protein
MEREITPKDREEIMTHDSSSEPTIPNDVEPKKPPETPPRVSASPPPIPRKRRGGLSQNVLGKEIQKFHRWRLGKSQVKTGMTGLLEEMSNTSVKDGQEEVTHMCLNIK